MTTYCFGIKQVEVVILHFANVISVNFDFLMTIHGVNYETWKLGMVHESFRNVNVIFWTLGGILNLMWNELFTWISNFFQFFYLRKCFGKLWITVYMRLHNGYSFKCSGLSILSIIKLGICCLMYCWNSPYVSSFPLILLGIQTSILFSFDLTWIFGIGTLSLVWLGSYFL